MHWYFLPAAARPLAWPVWPAAPGWPAPPPAVSLEVKNAGCGTISMLAGCAPGGITGGEPFRRGAYSW